MADVRERVVAGDVYDGGAGHPSAVAPGTTHREELVVLALGRLQLQTGAALGLDVGVRGDARVDPAVAHDHHRRNSTCGRRGADGQSAGQGDEGRVVRRLAV